MKKAFLSGMGGNAFCWTVTIKLSIRMLLLFAEYDMIIDVKGNTVVFQTMKRWLYVNKIVCFRGWRKIRGTRFFIKSKDRKCQAFKKYINSAFK